MQLVKERLKRVLFVLVTGVSLVACSSDIEKKDDELTQSENVVNSVEEDVTLDTIHEKAEAAVNNAQDLEGSQKIDSIALAVTKDWSEVIELDVLEELLNELVNDFEEDKLESNAPFSLYLTRLLDKQLDNYSDLTIADGLAFDMFQICKEWIRGVNDPTSLETNISQVNDAINELQ